MKPNKLKTNIKTNCICEHYKFYRKSVKFKKIKQVFKDFIQKNKNETHIKNNNFTEFLSTSNAAKDNTTFTTNRNHISFYSFSQDKSLSIKYHPEHQDWEANSRYPIESNKVSNGFSHIDTFIQNILKQHFQKTEFSLEKILSGKQPKNNIYIEKPCNGQIEITIEIPEQNLPKDILSEFYKISIEIYANEDQEENLPFNNIV